MNIYEATFIVIFLLGISISTYAGASFFGTFGAIAGAVAGVILSAICYALLLLYTAAPRKKK